MFAPQGGLDIAVRFFKEAKAPLVGLADPAQQAMGGTRRRESLHARRRSAGKLEGMVRDLADAQSAVSGRGE